MVVGEDKNKVWLEINSHDCINFDVTGCKHCEAPDREIQAALQVKGG